MVSASVDAYLAPVAAALGVELVCSRLEYVDGKFTGHFAGSNCNGEQKVSALYEHFPELASASETGLRFEVYGNSSADYAMLELASANKDAHFNDFVPFTPAVRLKNLLRLLRIQQYLKNFFVFIPIFFAGRIFDLESLGRAAACFVVFCCIASFIYVLNDLQDIESDRQHPYKRFRPLAYGTMLPKVAVAVAVLLVLCGGLISYALSPLCALLALAYVLLNLAYVYYIKSIALFDICCVAIGFNLRVFAGAVACDIPISAWLVLMVFLLSMFLVTGKRWDDLSRTKAPKPTPATVTAPAPASTSTEADTAEPKVQLRRSLYGYNKDFALSTLTFLSAINTVCYILYTMDASVLARLNSPYLYMTALWVVLGNLRYLQNIFVFKQGFSPTKVLLHDRGLAFCLVGWLISMMAIIYF